jgi:methylmalonyl-CoA mutase N-terminal domain/subunit
VIAYETGVVDTADPLAGSYYVENLTDRMEAGAEDYFQRIEEMGGVLAGIEDGFFQREIADAAYRFQQEVDRKERLIIGVNAFLEEETESIPVLRIDPDVERVQRESLQAVRAHRDQAAVDTALDAVRNAAANGRNLMEPILDAVRVYATEGEIIGAMRAVFGTYREVSVF